MEEFLKRSFFEIDKDIFSFACYSSKNYKKVRGPFFKMREAIIRFA